MSPVRRALWVDTDMTILDDGSTWSTPEQIRDGTLPALLDRLASIFGPAGEGVAVIGKNLAQQLNLIDDNGQITPRPDHPAVADWGDWCAFRRTGTPTIRLALDPLCDREKSPIWGPEPADTVRALALWHRLTGYAYHNTPGVAGLTILRALAGRGSATPTWHPDAPVSQGEAEYAPEDWHGPRSGKAFAHAYDFNRFYLAAAANVEVARATLRPGPTTFELAKHRHLAGWWEVELSPWQDRRLPDPAGYDPSGEGRTIRPVTTPTMILLAELAAEGIYGGARVIRSWVAQGSTVLRPWAWRMRDAGTGYGPDRRPVPAADGDMARVRATVKMAGRATLGLLARQTNWAYRPDWWHAIIAMARVNMWRKLRRTGIECDIWPGWIDVDTVWYPTDEPDPRRALPATFKDGARAWPLHPSNLGHVKYKGTRRSKSKRGEQQ